MFCFANKDDLIAYIRWLTEYAEQFQLQVQVQVQVHAMGVNQSRAFTGYPMMENGLSLMMQALGHRYVRYFNYTYQRSGTL